MYCVHLPQENTIPPFDSDQYSGHSKAPPTRHKISSAYTSTSMNVFWLEYCITESVPNTTVWRHWLHIELSNGSQGSNTLTVSNVHFGGFFQHNFLYDLTMPLNCERKFQHICKYVDFAVICDNLKKKHHDLQIIYYVCLFTVKSFNSNLHFQYTTPCSFF